MAELLEARLDLSSSAARLDLLRQRTRDMAIGAAVVAVAGAALLALGERAVGIACLVGAAVGVAIAGLTRADRAHLRTRLVAQGAEWAHADTRSWAEGLVTAPKRARLARSLERAAAARASGANDYVHVRPDRAQAVRADLLRLATAFRDESRPVAPRSAALCQRMLCEAAVSPLYNPNLPAKELDQLLREIEAGVGSSAR